MNKTETNVPNQTMENQMNNEQKTNPANPEKTSNTPELTPEQQEWLHNEFLPKVRSQMRQSTQHERSLTDAERQELVSYRDQMEQVAQQELEQKGEFEELLRRQKDESARKYAAIEREKNELADRFVNTNIEHALINSANLHKAIRPRHVLDLLRRHVAVDNYGEISVLDDDGHRMIGKDGEFMSVDKFVEQFIHDNPHMVKVEEKKPEKPAAKATNGFKIDHIEPSDPFVGVTGGDLIRVGLEEAKEKERQRHLS